MISSSSKLFTKFALVFGCLVFYQINWLSGTTAICLALVLLGLNFWIDSLNLQVLVFSYAQFLIGIGICVFPVVKLGNYLMGNTKFDNWGILALIYCLTTILRGIFFFTDLVGVAVAERIFGPDDPPERKFCCKRCRAPTGEFDQVCWNCNYSVDDLPELAPPTRVPDTSFVPVERRE